jgi:NAD(P)-dependent dehydrogenase (short-subunit alcohol dehydrogenase family)
VDERAVAVVTGANSGIGRAIAVHLASKGYRVFGTVRRIASAEKMQAMAAAAGAEVELVEMDVADDTSVRTGIADVLDQAGRIDVLVNNAGIGGNGVVEEATPDAHLEVMNVNLCGAIRCTQAVLPGMRERHSGTIVNITSIVGRFGALAQAPYVASKWALEGLSEELAMEVAPFGVRVVVIEPGITKSAIFAKNPDVPSTTGAYDAHNRRMLQMYSTGIPQGTDPMEVAEVVYESITTDTPKFRYTVSWGGDEIVGGRARMTDEEWVAIGATHDDDEYYRRFESAFGLSIAPTVGS